MMGNVFLLCLLFLLTSLTGACPPKPEEIYVREGEMVALLCTGSNHSDTKLVWTGYTLQKMVLSTDMSSAEQRQLGLLVHGRSLVIFNVSVNHQGNYSCSLGNASSQIWFKLTVYTTHSTKNEERNKYSKVCHAQESCTLRCPEVNIPDVNTPNITSVTNIVWHKEGELLPIKSSYFSSVKDKDKGVYTCTRFYLYNGRKHKMTFRVLLDVQPKEPMKTEGIIKPNHNDVFYIDLGLPKVIECEAIVFSELDEVFWLSDITSFVEMNDSFPVFYNTTTEDTKVRVSLVFKNVSMEDLSKNYTCKLDSVSQPSTFVTIKLAQKSRPSYTSLALVVVCIVVVMSVTVIIYVKLKTDITLFLRDTLGCHRSPSDGKSYDAFLLCYNSDADVGLKDSDRKLLENILETCYGYSLCLCDRDILPGRAEAEAVLDCIEKSRTVVLVPTPPDSGPGSSLLSAIHAALVERQSHLIFIKTEKTKKETSGSLPEDLQLLSKYGDYVTWKGTSSLSLSSSFFKELRYYLPASPHSPNTRPLLQTMQEATSW